MPPAKIDMTGMIFGRLTVIGDSGRRQGYDTIWVCECQCGNSHEAAGGHLRYGKTRSCGCYRDEKARAENTTHGHSRSRSREYATWKSMIARTRYASSRSFSYYGARGITVCERWQNFENFLADMGPRPHGMTLDRIDCNLGYELGNCRWATPQQQANNRRNTLFGVLDGETMSLKDISRRTGASYKKLRRLAQSEDAT